MCHGQIISERIQRARRERGCDNCGGKIEAGKQRHVLAVKDGTTLWQNDYCLTCSALLTAAPRDYEGCSLNDRSEQREWAKHGGWRATLGAMRAAKASVMERLGRMLNQ